jgi:hypothetical protein
MIGLKAADFDSREIRTISTKDAERIEGLSTTAK